MKKFIILSLLLCSTAFSQSFLEETNPKGWLWDRISSIDLGFSGDLFDQTFYDSLGLSITYAYEVESSHREGYFSRVDKFRTKVKVQPGDIISGTSSPLYLHLKRESEIVFIRQFKKKWDAVKALPYTPLRLPYNADQALKNLKPGDFVALPTSMSIVTGAQVGFGDDEFAEGKAGVYYLIQGQFLIHVFRLKDNKVRLKLIATRNREGGVRGSVQTGLNVFGIDLLDGIIKKITKFDPIEVNAGLGNGGQLLLDYIFDLKDPKARAAYDKILSSRYRFTDLSLVRDTIGKFPIEDRLHSTFVMAENLVREDIGKPNQRVEQLFKGINHFKKTFRRTSMGLPFIDYEKQRLYVRNNLVYESPEGEKSKYYFPFSAKYRKKKFLRGPLKSEEEFRRTLFGLAEVNKENPDAPYELGFSTEYDDDKFTVNEQENFIKYFNYQVPKTIREKIKWGNWRKKEVKRDVKLYYQITLHSDALSELKKIKYKDFKRMFHTYYSSVKSITGEKAEAKLLGRLRLTMFAKKLFKVLQKTSANSKLSLDRIFKLRNKSLFYKYGIGFLLSMVPEESLERFVSMKLNIVSPNDKGIQFEYGPQGGDLLFQQLRSLLAVIDDRNYDFRITTTSDHLSFLETNAK